MAESKRTSFAAMREKLESELRFRVAAGVLSLGEWVQSLHFLAPEEYDDRPPATDPQPDVMGALEDHRAVVEIMRARESRGEGLYHPADGWRLDSLIQERLGVLAGRGCNGAGYGEGLGHG